MGVDLTVALNQFAPQLNW